MSAPDTAIGQNLPDLSENVRPELPRGVKLRFDETRKCWLLLAPERMITLNMPAVEILSLCDGHRCLGEIITALADKFQADRTIIARDTRAMLASLREKRMVDV